MIEWPTFYGSQPGYECVEIDGEEAARIGIHEAIYLAQCAARPKDNSVYIETPDGDTLNFPEPVPSTLVRDTVLDFYLDQDFGLSHQLNPLLSPSLNHYREEVPLFFENGDKYLTTTRLSGDVLGEINQLDRVAVSNTPTQLWEPLTIAVVSLYLRQQGYIVDPFSESLATPNNGHPDLFAVKLPDYQRRLAEEGITDGGFYLNELELPDFSGPTTQLPDREETVVLEIESVRDDSFYDAKNETGDYLTGGWFDAGYGVRGFAEDRLESWRDRLEVGFITFDATGEFTTAECPRDYGKSKKTAEVRERVRTIVKLTLLKNLPLEETLDLLDANSFYDTVPAARDTDLETILSKLHESEKISTE